MAVSVKIEFLGEPTLQFGHFFQHEDTKTGLAEYGPYGKSVEGLHASDIRLGFVGTRETIGLAQEWIDECGGVVESESTSSSREAVPKGGLFSLPKEEEALVRAEKIINRDFIGFSKDSQFESQFVFGERWERILRPIEIKRILVPGGVTLLVTPNEDSLTHGLRRFLGAKRDTVAAVHPPHHLHGFTPVTMKRIIERAGLTPLLIKTTMPVDPAYVTSNNMRSSTNKAFVAAWHVTQAVGQGSVLVGWLKKEG